VRDATCGTRRHHRLSDDQGWNTALLTGKLRLWRKVKREYERTPKGGWFAFLHIQCSRADWFKRYALYLKSRAWEQRRNGALLRADGRCQLCNYSKGLQVHHVRYTNVGKEPISDFRVLCLECHKQVHVSGEYIPPDPATRAEAERRAVRATKAPETPARKVVRRIGGIRATAPA
jgi:hypothetical protein